MSNILKDWMTDAEAFEMQKSYGVNNIQQYEFVNRQGDFYITLLCRMYETLEEVENAKYDEREKELVDIAQSMLVYSEKTTAQEFSGVNVLSNQLYVATIYFLIRYEAVASLLLRNCDINKYETDSAQLIYYIVSGGNCDIMDIEKEAVRERAVKIRSYILNGDGGLEDLLEKTKRKFKDFIFDDVDDFFDTAILLHVLEKFSANNIRKTLNTVNCETDWTEYIKHSFEQHILSFLPSQEDAICKGLLEFNKAFSLKMPTSAGKSYITELVIYQELRRNPQAKILYLAPLRSLSRELRERFRELDRKLGFRSTAIYGGDFVSANRTNIDNVNVLISTPESFVGLEANLSDHLSAFSLVICDEGQLLEDSARGLNYELLLTRLKKINKARFLFISAIIPNINDINTWLGGKEEEVGDSTYRPCPIKFAHIQEGFNLSVLDENYDKTKYVITNFLSPTESKNLKTSIKAKASAIALKSVRYGSAMLFTATKGTNQGCISICKEIDGIIKNGVLPSPLDKSSNVQELEVVASYVSYQFGANHSLPIFIRNGYAYHHGGLPQDIREIIEQNYSKTVIPLLICTTTLAEGVNLPIQTLVLDNVRRYNNVIKKPKALSPIEIKNIIGRAGRAGLQRYGLVIYANDKKDAVYRNIVSALKNKNSHDFLGYLFYVILAFNEYENESDEKRISNILEQVGFAEAIDTMIARSIENGSLENIDIEDIIKESLAYHVGDKNTRETLKKVFSARRWTLSKKVSESKFEIYRSSGISLNDMSKIEELINDATVNNIDLSSPLSESWVDFVINVVIQLPSFKSADINAVEWKWVLNKSELKTLLINWMDGKQYYEIASILNCGVDNAVDLVRFLQDRFCVKASSVIRYMDLIGIDVTGIADWVEMVKRGINSHKKLMLMKSGLTDRILVNALLDDKFATVLNFDDENLLRNSMRTNRAKALTIAENSSLPTLCIRHLKAYMKAL